MFKAFLIGYGILAFVDTSQTMYGIGAGKVHEVNPIFRACTDHGAITAGVCKGAGSVGVVEGLREVNKTHPKWAMAGAIGATVLQVIVVTKSAKELRK